LVDDNKEGLHSEKVLTMNVLFEEVCRLEKVLMRDTSLKSEECEKYRLRVEGLYQKMKESKPSPSTKELLKIIDHQNYLGLTSIISKLIKSFLNFHIKPLYEDRERLRTRIQKGDLKLNEKYEILNNIDKITKILEKRKFSSEFLYRELYISELSILRGIDRPPA
jgi:hypothetical protein